MVSHQHSHLPTPTARPSRSPPGRPPAKAKFIINLYLKRQLFVASKATPLERGEGTTLSFPPGTATLTSPPGQGGGRKEDEQTAEGHLRIYGGFPLPLIKYMWVFY